MLRVAVAYRFEAKSQPYMDAVREAGAEPVGITPERPLTSLGGFAGLLLTGGTDIDPALYGQSRDERSEEPDRERDAMDRALLGEALAQDLPVLAICRGMQLFNVVHGGSLLQHVDGHAVRPEDKSLAAHAVQIASGSRLAGITGTRELQVNSRHHQAVDRVGGGLIASARSIPDGLIEGLENPAKRFAIAVQWHPEDQIRQSSEQRELFRAFATVCL